MALVLSNARPNRRMGLDNVVEEFDVDHLLVELRVTSTSGLGLIAKQDIPRGSRILSEAALVVVSEADMSDHSSVWTKLEKLSPTELDQFHSLCVNKHLLCAKSCSHIRNAVIASGKFRQCPKLLEGFVEMEAHRVAILRTNATSLGDGPGLGVFPLYSRINHSCTPTAHASFNRSLGQHLVHVISDIKAGEEILTSYIDCIQPRKDSSYGLAAMGIDCCCISCERTAAVARSDRHRDRLHDLTRGLRAYDGKIEPKERPPAKLIPQHPKEALAMAEESLMLLKEEALIGMPSAEAYRQASRYCIQLGMVEKAKAYARNELEIERVCMGKETEYLNDGSGSGNAEQWIKRIDFIAEKEKVKIRMCEKRSKKEQKKLDKKAAKKGGI